MTCLIPLTFRPFERLNRPRATLCKLLAVLSLLFVEISHTPAASAADDALLPIKDLSSGERLDYRTIRCSSFVGAVFIYRYMLRTNRVFGPAGRNNKDFDWIDAPALGANLKAARTQGGPKNYEYTQKYLKAFGAVTSRPVLVNMPLYLEDKATCLEQFG